MAFAETAHWFAKLPAAERVLPTVGSFAPLVRAAVASFRAGRSTSAPLLSDEVDRFLDKVLATLTR